MPHEDEIKLGPHSPLARATKDVKEMFADCVDKDKTLYEVEKTYVKGELPKDDLVIINVGQPGQGKTLLMNAMTGRHIDQGVSHGLEHGTRGIKETKLVCEDRDEKGGKVESCMYYLDAEGIEDMSTFKETIKNQVQGRKVLVAHLCQSPAGSRFTKSKMKEVVAALHDLSIVVHLVMTNPCSATKQRQDSVWKDLCEVARDTMGNELPDGHKKRLKSDLVSELMKGRLVQREGGCVIQINSTEYPFENPVDGTTTEVPPYGVEEMRCVTPVYMDEGAIMEWAKFHIGNRGAWERLKLTMAGFFGETIPKWWVEAKPVIDVIGGVIKLAAGTLGEDTKGGEEAASS